MSRFHPGSPEEQQWSLGSTEVPPSDSRFLQPQCSGGGKGQLSPNRELPFSQRATIAYSEEAHTQEKEAQAGHQGMQTVG